MAGQWATWVKSLSHCLSSTLPNIELSLQTLWIILPYSLTLAIVGILESLLTATIVDEMTETKSPKDKEVKGQGIANMVYRVFRGHGGLCDDRSIRH